MSKTKDTTTTAEQAPPAATLDDVVRQLKVISEYLAAEAADRADERVRQHALEQNSNLASELAPTSPTARALQRLENINETLFRAGQLLASIDERLTPRSGPGPSAAARADSSRPLSNTPQWSENVSGNWR